MRKIIIYIVLIILVLFTSFSGTSFASSVSENTIDTNYIENNISNAKGLNVYSDCILMVERNTGDVLYERNANEKMYPASTTKILTSIIVLENCDLDEVAAVSSTALKAVPPTYTTANLQIGEEFKIKDLLYAMLIPSANDAANVLAEHVSGSITGFSELMNEKATQIGCMNSHFTNPSGVHDENLYTTAYDLSLIARYALKFDTFREIIKTTSYTLPSTEIHPKEDRTFAISNALLKPSFKNYYYQYATGIKTGYTNSAKDCLVASAKKDDVEFIIVVLNCGYVEGGLREKYLDCKTLFDFAFDNYTTYYKDLQVNLENLLNKSDGPESSLTSDKTYGSKDYDFLDLCLKIGCVIIVLFAFKLLFSRKKRNKRKRTRH